MSDLARNELKVSSFRKSGKISEEIATLLVQKLRQNDQNAVSLFKTLDWSENEEAFLQKVKQLPFSEGKASNFSTETSLKTRERPPSVVVPANRMLKNYLVNFNDSSTSLESPKHPSPKKPVEQKSQVFLAKMKCFQELKFESDASDSEDKESSLNSLDLEIGKSDEKEKLIEAVDDFFKKNKNEGLDDGVLLEKRMSIDEILEKYDQEIAKEDGFEFLGDEEGLEGEEGMDDKENKIIPVINRSKNV